MTYYAEVRDVLRSRPQHQVEAESDDQAQEIFFKRFGQENVQLIYTERDKYDFREVYYNPNVKDTSHAR